LRQGRGVHTLASDSRRPVRGGHTSGEAIFMAEEIAIRGSNYPAKQRDPIVTILLNFVPFYGLFYYYYVNKELAELGTARGTDELGDNPMMSVLAVFPGVFLFAIPTIISFWNFWKRQDTARKMFGVQTGVDNVPGFLLYLFIAPVGIWFLQQGQNGVLEAQASA
jgi:hypothetical protein